jgi:hypothetical protein
MKNVVEVDILPYSDVISSFPSLHEVNYFLNLQIKKWHFVVITIFKNNRDNTTLGVI